jgi:hypothetical protein
VRQSRVEVYVVTTPAELNAWLGKQSCEPVTVAKESTDLVAELNRGLAFIKKRKDANTSAERQPKKAKLR